MGWPTNAGSWPRPSELAPKPRVRGRREPCEPHLSLIYGHGGAGERRVRSAIERVQSGQSGASGTGDRSVRAFLTGGPRARGTRPGRARLFSGGLHGDVGVDFKLTNDRCESASTTSAGSSTAIVGRRWSCRPPRAPRRLDRRIRPRPGARSSPPGSPGRPPAHGAVRGTQGDRNGGPSPVTRQFSHQPETTSSSPFRTGFGCSWWSGQSTASTNPLPCCSTCTSVNRFTSPRAFGFQ